MGWAALHATFGRSPGASGAGGALAPFAADAVAAGGIAAGVRGGGALSGGLAWQASSVAPARTWKMSSVNGADSSFSCP